MADEHSDKLKLAYVKNVYQHYKKEHLYFSNPEKVSAFQV